MPSKRKFYRCVYKIEILSEEPIREDLDLQQINYIITEGECSGVVEAGEEQEVDGPAMAKMLMEQQSDPSFFGLSEDGEDIER